MNPHKKGKSGPNGAGAGRDGSWDPPCSGEPAQNDQMDSESRYRLLADNASDVIWTCDKTGKFTYVSPSVERLRGYTAEEVIGQTWEEALTEKSCVKARELFSKRFDAKDPGALSVNRVELEQPCKGGGTVWTETITSPLRDQNDDVIGILGVTRNIDERRAVEEALKESESRFRDLVELAPQPVFELNHEGYITFISKKAREYFGFTQEQLQGGVHGLELIAPESRELAIERLERALAGEELTNLEYRAQRSDGSTFPCLIPTCPIIKDGKPSGLRGIVVDISEWKMAGELHANAEKLKAVTELASGISHNFNNALQIIQGNAQIARAKAEKHQISDLYKNLDQIIQSSKLASETVNRLHSFSRRDAGSTGWEIFDLSELVEEAMEMSRVWHESMAARMGVRIEVTSDLKPGCRIAGKSSELFEALVNLFKNAVEAMPKGGEIHVRTDYDNKRAMVRLRDTGDGIPPENITRIFDPFYSGKGGPNAGMGLAVTQRIIESHGGSITAESRQGEGSLFKMELPLTSAEFDCSRDRKTASPDFQANILVVDDLRPVVEMISEGLREAGQTVIEADSGEQAIESYKNNAIDIVICDLAMPGMNGWAVWEELERIRRDRGVARPPFIMLSGWNEEDLNRSESSRSDLIQFVKKPVEMDRLLVIVRDLLEHGNMRSPH